MVRIPAPTPHATWRGVRLRQSRERTSAGHIWMISDTICTGGSCRTMACRKVMPLNSSAVDIILARDLKVEGLERPISYRDC